jgi:head-tail adaptor
MQGPHVPGLGDADPSRRDADIAAWFGRGRKAKAAARQSRGSSITCQDDLALRRAGGQQLNGALRILERKCGRDDGVDLSARDQCEDFRQVFVKGLCVLSIQQRNAVERSAASAEAVIRFELEVWIAMHEDMKLTLRVRMLFDHLAAGLSAFVRGAGLDRGTTCAPARRTPSFLPSTRPSISPAARRH